MNDPRFTRRACPLCGDARSRLVIEMRAQDFCAANPTYASSYRQILEIDEESRYPIVECGGCKFVYAAYVPNAQFLALVYEKVIQHQGNISHNETPAGYARRMAYVSELLALAPGNATHRALDFGCGLGVTLRILGATGIDSVGYDFSDVRNSYAVASDLRMVTGEDALLTAGPFDLLICDNVIEHLPDPLATLQLLASVATPGAVMYVSVPNGDHQFFLRQTGYLQAGRAADMSLNPWEHLSYFDVPHLDQLMARAGFEPIPDTDPRRGVNIGLRAEPARVSRLKNSLASLPRLINYALTGQAARNPNHGFYRRRA